MRLPARRAARRQSRRCGSGSWFNAADRLAATGRKRVEQSALLVCAYPLDGGSEAKVDKNITGTDDDPLYQTFRKGLTAYRFDVPDGSYEVELRFVEPQFDKPGKRVFSILMNGATLVEKIDLAKDAGLLHAVSRTLRVQADGGKGIELRFNSVSGEALLSGIRIRRLP